MCTWFLAGTFDRSQAQRRSTTLFSTSPHKKKKQASPFSLFFASELTPLTLSAPVGFGEMTLDNGTGAAGGGGAAGGAGAAAATTTTEGASKVTAADAAVAAFIIGSPPRPGTRGATAAGIALSPTGGAFDVDCLEVHGRCVGVCFRGVRGASPWNKNWPWNGRSPSFFATLPSQIFCFFLRNSRRAILPRCPFPRTGFNRKDPNFAPCLDQGGGRLSKPSDCIRTRE